MKKFPKIRTPKNNISDSKFNQLAQGVLESLTDNDFFPDIAPELLVFKTAFDKYFNSIPPRNIRNSVNTAAKNANKEKGVPIFVQMQLENAHGFSPWSDSVTGMIPTQTLIASVHE